VKCVLRKPLTLAAMRSALPYTDESKTAKALGLDVRTAANDEVVPLAGLEPARCCHHLILSQVSDISWSFL
jgi:hypothetical protein